MTEFPKQSRCENLRKQRRSSTELLLWVLGLRDIVGIIKQGLVDMPADHVNIKAEWL